MLDYNTVGKCLLLYYFSALCSDSTSVANGQGSYWICLTGGGCVTAYISYPGIAPNPSITFCNGQNSDGICHAPPQKICSSLLVRVYFGLLQVQHATLQPQTISAVTFPCEQLCVHLGQFLWSSRLVSKPAHRRFASVDPMMNVLLAGHLPLQLKVNII